MTTFVDEGAEGALYVSTDLLLYHLGEISERDRSETQISLGSRDISQRGNGESSAGVTEFHRQEI